LDEWAVNESTTEDLVRKIHTLLRIGLGIQEPEKLTDDQLAMRWGELKWASKAGFLPFEMD
jgi:hypothetical protein